MSCKRLLGSVDDRRVLTRSASRVFWVDIRSSNDQGVFVWQGLGMLTWRRGMVLTISVVEGCFGASELW